MSITALTIRNFRSIENFHERALPLNIFVGHNDEGKSNVLRALDLFFNGEKRHGYELDWSRDYCAFSAHRERKADEISIALEVTPPRHFTNSKPLKWTKIWRHNGLHSDHIKHTDGSPIGARSKLPAFARSIRYDYVPAIKGAEYFQELMASLHDMLEATVEEKVRHASDNFTTTITETTQPILDGILRQLDLQSTISLPNNLRDLFGQLEFWSNYADQSFSLSQRGDGIKVRHIPIVLRWLAEQANALSSPGKPRTLTIWGYEEPENNLELQKCFELAQQFVTESDSIQTFVTSHSPAFYSVCRHSTEDRVRLFSVQRTGEPPTTHIRPLPLDNVSSLDSSMGLLNLLEPHFNEARQELDRLKIAQARMQDVTIATLFCEGPSDKQLLELTLAHYFHEQYSQVKVQCATDCGGGHQWVADSCIAWSYSRPEARAVGLFDKDPDARGSRDRLNKLVKQSSETKVYGVDLKPSDSLKPCLKKGFRVPYAIEELLPEDVWDFAEESGLLEERPNLLSTYGFDRADLSFFEHVNNSFDRHHERRLVLHKISGHGAKKKALCDYVAGQSNEDRNRILSGIRPSLAMCLDKLGLL